MPPTFDLETAAPSIPPTLRSSKRARSTRSASPSKALATPSRKMATPRKSARSTRSRKSESINGDELTEVFKSTASSSTTTHKKTSNDIADIAESVATDSINGETAQVRVEVEQKEVPNGDDVIITRNITVTAPADHPELRTPDDPTELIAQARRMVEAAAAIDATEIVPGASSKSKRKAADISKAGDDDEEDVEGRPAKQTKYTVEQKLQKEKVTRRALVGLGVMAAIGAAVQYLA